MVCPLAVDGNETDQIESKRIREMDERDFSFFQEKMLDFMLEFVQSLVEPVKGAVRASNIDFYI